MYDPYLAIKSGDVRQTSLVMDIGDEMYWWQMYVTNITVANQKVKLPEGNFVCRYFIFTSKFVPPATKNLSKFLLAVLATVYGFHILWITWHELYDITYISYKLCHITNIHHINRSYSRVAPHETIVYVSQEHMRFSQQNHSLPKRTFSIQNSYFYETLFTQLYSTMNFLLVDIYELAN